MGVEFSISKNGQHCQFWA